MDPLELVAERFFGTSYLHDPTAWAQEKLGVRTVAHAVAQAMRLRLIP